MSEKFRRSWPASASLSRSLSRWLKVLALAILLLYGVVYVIRAPGPRRLTFFENTESEERPRNLRLLVPASHSDANLCKTLLSAEILGYPTPVLINWNTTYNNDKLIFGGSHIAKIGGILNHLHSLPPKADADLALIVDGFDVWFQLRPSVLIERYYAINARANRRIRRSLGQAASTANISQTIIASSQKRCWPKEANHPACYLAPESTLPPDVYGPETDTDVNDEKNPYAKYRQRYLNSGSIIGPVAHVRAMFERAFEKAQKDQNFGSDQGIFAEILGEQEFNREVLRQRHWTVLDRAWNWLTNKFTGQRSLIEPHGNRIIIDTSTSRKLEFGLGIDYRSEIVQATVFAEDDTAWVRHNDSNVLEEVYASKKIPFRSHGRISDDIARSTAPFWSFDGGRLAHRRLPSHESWHSVPLFTNLWSGISPVAVHHNAHRDGMKSRRTSHWNKTWFFPHARSLLAVRSLEPIAPIATTYVDGKKQTWWSIYQMGFRRTWWTEHGKGGAITDQFFKGRVDPTFWPFGMVCNGTSKELFRDDEGEWEWPATVQSGNWQHFWEAPA